jgi:hypothetical protein
MNALTRKRKLTKPDRAAISASRASIARATSLRANFHLLDPEEQAELVALTRKIQSDAEPDVTRDSPDYLGDDDRRRYERLVAQAAGKAVGFFDRAREGVEAQTKIAALVERARRPAARAPHEGCLNLGRDQLLENLRRGAVWAEDLAVYVYLAVQLESGALLSTGARFEQDGDALVLVLSAGFGVVAPVHNPAEALRGESNSLENLARVEWLEVDRQGNEFRVRHGAASPLRRAS